MKVSTLEAGINANGIHINSDKNDLYVLRRCIIYLQRHLHRYPCFDSETLRLLCWVLGEDMLQLGNFLLTLADANTKANFEEQLKECKLNPDDYAHDLAEMIRKAKSIRKNSLFKFVSDLMKR